MTLDNPDLEQLLSEAAAELEHLAHPLILAAGNPFILFHLLHQIGWDLEQLLVAPAGDVALHVGNILDGLRSAEATLQNTADFNLLEDGPALGQILVDTAEEIRALSTRVADAVEELAQLADADDGHKTMLAGALASDMGELLLIRYLAGRAPLFFGLSRLVGLVAPANYPALYSTPTPAENDYPLRLPIRRLAVNTRGIANAVRLPADILLTHLNASAFLSPEAFFGALQTAITDLLEYVLAVADPSQITSLTVSVSPTAIELQAPGLIPRVDGSDSYSLLIPLSWPAPSGGAAAPAGLPEEIILTADCVQLKWTQSSDDTTLVIVEDRLEMLRSAAGLPNDYQPGILVSLDLSNPSDVASEMHLGAVLRLSPADMASSVIGLSLDLQGRQSTGFSLAASVMAAGDITLPVPAIESLAVIITQPEIAFRLDSGAGLSLYAHVTAGGFGILLPTVLFRKAVRAGTEWLPEGTARIDFRLESQTPGPLVELRLGEAAGDDGNPGSTGQVTQLSLIQPQGNDRLVVYSDPLFIGPDDPDYGFVLDIDDFAWNFGDGSSLLGGLAVEQATIYLPPALEVIETVTVTDATLTRQGFSGSVSVLFGASAGGKLFGSLNTRLTSLYLEFVDNLPTALEVKVAAELPYFNQWVDLTIGIGADFTLLFKLESQDPAGIVLTKDELFRLVFRSALIKYEDSARLLTLGLSGGVEPLLWQADGLEWPRLDVTNLVIEQDLSAPSLTALEPPVLKFAEAWLDLKDLATLDLFGFHFELNRIGMGYVESTDQLWIDLTGSLRLIDLIPVGLGVEGFRITWPRRIYEDLNIIGRSPNADELLALAAKIEVKFDGVYLFFGIPNAVEFEGFIAFIKEAQKVGFAGAVALRVPSTGLAIDAGLLVGMNFADPPYPFLYVQFGILLPTGIPLGQSGLALKGARGLFGMNVTPDRTPEQNPYYDWYKRGPIEGVYPPNKWRDQIWSIAFGAGITITTVDGKIFGVSGLLALVIPGPIIFIEGKALIFDGLFPGDGPLKALGYFDGNSLTAQFNIEANLELVEGLIDVHAVLEAFFDFQDLLNWHLYLGQNQPADRRIRANILNLPSIGWLFEANSYLMLDMLDRDTLQARLGAYIGFDPPTVDLVIAQATVHAVIDGSGMLTLNPFQFNGGLALEALVQVSAFGLPELLVDADASVAVEGPLPFVVDARVTVHVDLPVPNVEEIPVVGEWIGSAIDWFEENITELPDIPEYIDIEVPFHWEFDGPPVIDPLLREVSVESHFPPASALALPAAASQDLWQAPVVPLDARPTLVFDQNVNQAGGLRFGGFASNQVQRFHSGKLAFRPHLQEVSIWRLPVHKFDPALPLDSQSWELAARAGGTGQQPELWGAFRPQAEGGDPSRLPGECSTYGPATRSSS